MDKPTFEVRLALFSKRIHAAFVNLAISLNYNKARKLQNRLTSEKQAAEEMRVTAFKIKERATEKENDAHDHFSQKSAPVTQAYELLQTLNEAVK